MQDTKAAEKEIITPAEIASRLCRSQPTIEKWLRQKVFPIGTAIYDEVSDRWSYIIPREAFENWMAGTKTVYVERCVSPEYFQGGTLPCNT